MNNSPTLVRSADFIQQQGRFWMPAITLGEKLGYKNPSDGIYRIFKRNSDELEPFTMIDKMSISGDTITETRIFDEQGCYIIAMLAKTDQAKAFRKGLARFLQKLRGNQAKAMQMRFKIADLEEQYNELRTKKAHFELQETIDRTEWTWGKLERMHELKEVLSAEELGRLYDCHPRYMRQMSKRYRMATGDFRDLRPKNLMEVN